MAPIQTLPRFNTSSRIHSLTNFILANRRFWNYAIWHRASPSKRTSAYQLVSPKMFDQLNYRPCPPPPTHRFSPLPLLNPSPNNSPHLQATSLPPLLIDPSVRHCSFPVPFRPCQNSTPHWELNLWLTSFSPSRNFDIANMDTKTVSSINIQLLTIQFKIALTDYNCIHRHPHPTLVLYISQIHPHLIAHPSPPASHVSPHTLNWPQPLTLFSSALFYTLQRFNIL